MKKINIKIYENKTCQANIDSLHYYRCTCKAQYIINSRLLCKVHAEKLIKKGVDLDTKK